MVEACHSWLKRPRALPLRGSKTADPHRALLRLACGLIASKKARAARLAEALSG